jgi:hypothetical protein
MKFFFLFYSILLLATQFSFSQSPVSRKITYKISVTDSSLRPAKGYLFNITDSSLKVGFWPVVFGDPKADKEKYKEINFQHISEISLKRNHGAGRGAWKGAVIGLVTGVIAGFVEGDDPPEDWFGMTASEKALTYSGMGAGLGAGIGALIGALAKKRFIIGGRKEKFDEMKANVLTKVYGNSNTR